MNNLKELSIEEMVEIEGAWVLHALRGGAIFMQCLAHFDEWYQKSGYIDRDMGIPFSA